MHSTDPCFKPRQCVAFTWLEAYRIGALYDPEGTWMDLGHLGRKAWRFEEGESQRGRNQEILPQGLLLLALPCQFVWNQSFSLSCPARGILSHCIQTCSRWTCWRLGIAPHGQDLSLLQDGRAGAMKNVLCFMFGPDLCLVLLRRIL